MAIYLPTLDALFVAVPKTGSNWVERALAESNIPTAPAAGPGQHGPPDAYKRAGRRFCFVRHPMTWVESAWRGLHSSWPQRRDVKPLHHERTWSPIRNLTYLAGDRDFNGFVECLLSREPGFVSRMFETYTGPIGLPRVDFVGRKENLATDLQSILTALGWDGILANIPPANEGTGPAAEWHPELLRRFLTTELPAILRWYTSPGPFGVTTE